MDGSGVEPQNEDVPEARYWQLRLVGESTLVAADGVPCDLSTKSKRFAVLVFLAIPSPGRWIRRDVLLATFWPELDSARARNALRSTLHQLRNTLGVDAILSRGDEEVALDVSRVWVDVAELFTALDHGDAVPWVARPSLDLAPGLHVADAGPFHEWLEAQRRALNALIVRTAWKVADDATASSDAAHALAAARVATRLAPEDETGRRRLISLLDRFGDRAGALAEFEQFEIWLREEFEVSPAPETIALVQRVRDRTESNAASHGESFNRRGPMPEKAAIAIAPAKRLSRRRLALPIAIGAAIVVAGTLWITGAKPSAGLSSLPVAVLPFENQISDTSLAYVAPALAESIADELTSPIVVPYDTTRAIDRRDERSEDAHLRRLGARTVVRATVGKPRDSVEVRLTIRSLDGSSAVARDVTLLGSERKLVGLRDTMVAEIRRLTGVSVHASTAGRHVPPPEVLRLNLAARYLNARRTQADLLKARDMYTAALDIDPEWSELYLGLASVWGGLAYRHFVDFQMGFRASEKYANEALLRAEHDARPLVERAAARFQLGDFGGAEADIKRAEDLDVGDWHMQSLIGTWWQWSGSQLDSALFYTERARRLAPWDRQTAINILEIAGCMKDSAAIIDRANQVLDIDPNEPETLEALAWTLTRFGRWDEATNDYKRAFAKFADAAGPAAKLTGEARFRATVREIRQALYDDQRRHPPSALPLLERRIALFEDLGMRDSSIATLSAVVDSLDGHHANMMCAPNLRGFRHDPRTLAIVKKRGWPAAEFATVP